MLEIIWLLRRWLGISSDNWSARLALKLGDTAQHHKPWSACPRPAMTVGHASVTDIAQSIWPSRSQRSHESSTKFGHFPLVNSSNLMVWLCGKKLDEDRVHETIWTTECSLLVRSWNFIHSIIIRGSSCGGLILFCPIFGPVISCNYHEVVQWCKMWLCSAHVATFQNFRKTIANAGRQGRWSKAIGTLWQLQEQAVDGSTTSEVQLQLQQLPGRRSRQHPVHRSLECMCAGPKHLDIEN